MVAAQPEPEKADSTRSLKLIMVSLAQDMGRISDGLWYEDYDMILSSARDVGNHPKITKEDMAAVKSALGESFSAFVAFDTAVHDAALDVADAARSKSVPSILKHYDRLRDGCLGCHAAYRVKVRDALYKPVE